MSKSLKHNLTSAYLGAADKLSPKKHRRRIIAYVESYDDIAFWRTLLFEHENEERYFQIMLPSNRSLTKGKKMVLMNALSNKGLGENLIACVDSDYDYLLQQTTKQSRQINNNPFVLQTYTYAIENFQCYAESLHEVCVQATLNDRQILDFPAFMRDFSRITYPLFLWHIWFIKNGQAEIFPIQHLADCTSIHEIDIFNPLPTLQSIERRVKNKISKFQRRYYKQMDEVDALGKELEPLGLNPDTTYLYMQGHHIFENIVLKLITPVCTNLRRERERQIKQLSVHQQQFQNELSCYENSLANIKLMLKKNDDFKKLPHYQQIQKDIEALLKKH